MHDFDQDRKRLTELLESQKLAVLSTDHKGQPYGSLVCFASTADFKEILFATTRSTRKFGNLKGNPKVAMVIDSRENAKRDLHAAMAVTATGEAQETPSADEAACIEIYLEKHPYLKDFLFSPTCALVRVHVDTYYLVSRFQAVTEIHTKDMP